MNLNNIKQAKRYIKEADGLIITSGSGMGVDSGLPDFRGDNGFWKAYPLIKKLGLSFSQMANPKWFDTNPKLAWAFYGHRLHLYRTIMPHDGFQMLLDLTITKNNNYFVFTSNVDGQFQKAGFDEQKIIECHGSIHYLQCTHNCSDNIWENDEKLNINMDSFEALHLPICKYCNKLARPNILMFQDWLWNANRTNTQEQEYHNFLNENKNKKIAIIEIGAGEAIPTVRLEGEELASVLKAKLIRINPRDYHINKTLGVGLNLGGLKGIREILS